MTEKEITEGNKLIAEFMGYRVFHKRYPRNHGIGAGMNQPKDCILEKCRYDHDWSWLMPVVEKIEGIYASDITTSIVYNPYRKHHCTISCYDYLSISVDKYDSKIEAVWNCVIKFIKWYNENKN